MKINNDVNLNKLNPSNQQQQTEAAGNSGKEHASKTGLGDGSSRVSVLARTIASAKTAADQLPDVRADKVALARERLANGFYDTPEAREVLVDKLLLMVKNTASK